MASSTNGKYPPVECLSVSPVNGLKPPNDSGKILYLALVLAALSFLTSLFTLYRISCYTDASRDLAAAIRDNTAARRMFK